MSGKKIIEGLEDVLAGRFERVTVFVPKGQPTTEPTEQRMQAPTDIHSRVRESMGDQMRAALTAEYERGREDGLREAREIALQYGFTAPVVRDIDARLSAIPDAT